MDPPSDPARVCCPSRDPLSVLPPDLLRRILGLVEGSAPQGSVGEGSPLAPLLLVCKVLREAAYGCITRVHLDTSKHSTSALSSLSPPLQRQIEHLSLRTHGDCRSVNRQIESLALSFPSLQHLTLERTTPAGWLHRQPSVSPLSSLPRLSHLSLNFSPKDGLLFLSSLEDLSLRDEHAILLTALPPSLRTLKLGATGTTATTATTTTTQAPRPQLLSLGGSSRSGSPLLHTAELRNLVVHRPDWHVRRFPLSSLTALTLAEIGELPPLVTLKNLETLSIVDSPSLALGRNDFEGLERLQVLKLHSLPKALHFPSGFNLSSLRRLCISEAGFQALKFREGEVLALEELVLERVSLEDDYVVFLRQTALKSLRIVDCSIRYLSSALEMPQLKTMHLERLPALKLIGLLQVPALESVHISHVPLEFIQLDGDEYPDLQKVHLEGLKDLDAASVTALPLPPSLRSLTLIDVPSELLPSLRDCTRLEELHLRALKPVRAPVDEETRAFDTSKLPNSLRRVEVSDVHIGT